MLILLMISIIYHIDQGSVSNFIIEIEKMFDYNTNTRYTKMENKEKLIALINNIDNNKIIDNLLSFAEQYTNYYAKPKMTEEEQ